MDGVSQTTNNNVSIHPSIHPARTGHDGVGNDGHVAVNVHAQVQLHHVALLDRLLRLRGQGRVVADALVHRHARREGHALVDHLALDLWCVVVDAASRKHARGGTDGRMDGQTDGWMEGWVDGWMNGWINGWME
jgi:hypothetical protein